MKLKKLLSAALSAVLALSTLSLCVTVGAQEGKKEKDDGTLTLHYSKIQKGNVDRHDWSTISEFTDPDMGSVIKIAPNVTTTANGGTIIDGYGIDNLGINARKYGYVTIEYKLVTNIPNEIKPYFTFHPGPQKSLVRKTVVRSGLALERDKWSTLTLNIGTALEPNIAEGKDNLSQIHFHVFGDIPSQNFADGDHILIRNLIFTEENPNPDALHQISFEAGANNANGESPKNIESKTGDKITLPEIPYEIKGMLAAGWYNELDGKLYKPGDSYTVGDSGVTFVVRWRTIFVPEEFLELEFPPYSNGICNGADTAKLSPVEIDGRNAMEIVPNINSEKGSIILDGWSYGGAKIDISGYETLMVEYKYVSENPIKSEAKPKFNIMKQTTFKGMTYLVAREPIVANRWALASFDLTPAREKILEGVDPVIMQAHIYPLGDIKSSELSENDRIYVSKIYVIPKKSTSAALHDSYINGYADGTFGVSGNMTRAEAATIVARLSAGDDTLVPTDKTTAFTDVPSDQWYHKYISYVESLGYLKSYSGQFLPNQNITRAEFVELVYNMGLLKDAGKNGTFTDVSADHPRAEVIAAAGKAGLVNGYDNGDGTFSFKPDATITRAEVVKVINNAYGRSPYADGIPASVKNRFSDVTAEHWAFAEIIDASASHMSYFNTDGKEEWIRVFGVVEGEDDGFTPDYAAGEAKAAEVEALINKRIAEIKATPNTTFDIKGTTYYVSASGSDDNDGKSEKTPFKTAKKANSVAKNGDLVLFKRGDMWRERWSGVAGVIYSAYGDGEKPIFNGNLHGNLAEEKYWETTDTKGIWRLTIPTSDVGNVIINDGELIYEKVLSKLSGSDYLIDNKKVTIPEMLSKNHTYVSIYKTVANGAASTAEETATLYVRCDEGNPGALYDSIEIATRNTLIGAGTGNVFDNLKLIYAGAHGIGMGTVNNVKFTNLEIGYIGGSIQHITNGNMTRFGNGIEVYGGCNGYTVENCYIYQCYDAGVTHQYSGGGTADIIQENVFYTNNVIDKCIYNIEYFIGAGDTSTVKRYMKNINIKNNLLARSGYGWGMSPSRSASIKGWEMTYNEADGFYIEDNVFYLDRYNAYEIGANSAVWLPTLKSNTYIQRYGNTLAKFGANGCVQYKLNANTATDLSEKIGEVDAKIFYLPAEKEA